MHSIDWCGSQWQVIGDVTTGEWYRALREVVAPLHQFAEAGDIDQLKHATDAACSFCADVIALDSAPVNRDVIMRAAAKFNQGKPKPEQQHIFPHLFNEVVRASSWGDHEPAIDAYYQTLFGSDGFDPELGDGPCACEECRNRANFDEHCLLRQEPITAFARQLASANPDDVLRYWDAPLYLYRHAQIKETHKGLAMAARNQKPVKEAMRNEERELFYNRLRNKLHG